MTKPPSRRLVQLPAAALKLERFWISSLSYRQDPEQDAPMRVRANPVTVWRNPSETSEYFLTLRIVVDADVHHVDLTLEGYFEADPSLSDEERTSLVHYNGPAILYGVARGVVASLTGASGFLSLQLPSVNMEKVSGDSLDPEFLD